MEYTYGNSEEQIKRINCLLHYLDLNKGASLEDILKHYELVLEKEKNKEISKRQFHYDKKLLKEEGVIIEYDSATKGYEITEFPEEKKKMKISDEYVYDLPILFSLINTGEHLPSVDWLKKELRKNYNIDEQLWENETYFSSSYIQQDNDVIIELGIKIIKYMKLGQAIEFEYRKVNTYEKAFYIIAPLQIRLSNDMYFLVGCKYDHLEFVPQINTFRIDMIKNLKIKEAKIINKDNEKIKLVYNYKDLAENKTNLKDYFTHCIGIFNPNQGGKKEEPKHIKLKFYRWACSQVLKKKLHPSQRIPLGIQKEMVDGKEEIFCVVHLYVFDTVELENLLGRFREDVRKFNKKNNTFEKILTFKNQ
jgi:predicted DNA-binding transcriptional regulator YafY